MAITQLTNQYISGSFQNLMQVSSSGTLYNGAGTLISSLTVQSITGSIQTAQTASYIAVAQTATTASYAVTASYSAFAAIAATATLADGALSVEYSNIANKPITPVSASISENKWTGDVDSTIDLTALGTTSGNGLVLPTTIPASPTTGSVYFASNRIHVYNGVTWISVVLS